MSLSENELGDYIYFYYFLLFSQEHVNPYVSAANPATLYRAQRQSESNFGTVATTTWHYNAFQKWP